MSYYTQQGPVYGIRQRELTYHEDQRYEQDRFSYEPRMHDKFAVSEWIHRPTEPRHFEDPSGFGQSDVQSERKYVEASPLQPQYQSTYEADTDETGIYQLGRFKKDPKLKTEQTYSLPDNNKRKEQAKAEKAKQNRNSGSAEQTGDPETIPQHDQTPVVPSVQRSLARYGRTPMNEMDHYICDDSTGFYYPKAQRKASEPLIIQPGPLQSRGTSFLQEPRYGEVPKDYLQDDDLRLSISRSLGGDNHGYKQYRSYCYVCNSLFEEDPQYGTVCPERGCLNRKSQIDRVSRQRRSHQIPE